MQARIDGGGSRLLFASLLLLGLGACTEAGMNPGTAAQPGTTAQPAIVAASAHPDFSGVWMAIGVENPDGGGTAARFTAEGQARIDAFNAQFTQVPEAGAACVGTGMPSVMLSLVSYPIEIAQTSSRLLMVAELETQIRRVFIDGRARSENAFPTGTGYSLGTWEGDTLVIDTTLLEEWPLPPWPRSTDAHVVERFSLTTNAEISVRRTGFVAGVIPPLNDDVLVVDITTTDPAYYDGPQHRIAYYQRMPDDATSEYACSQGLWYDELEKYRIEQ
jgi:hypothetical protein